MEDWHCNRWKHYRQYARVSVEQSRLDMWVGQCFGHGRLSNRSKSREFTFYFLILDYKIETKVRFTLPSVSFGTIFRANHGAHPGDMTHLPRIFSIVHQPTKDVTNYGAWCLASFVQTHKRMMQIMTHFALHHSTAHQHTNVHTSTNANAHTHTTLSNEHLAECPQLGFWRAEFAIGVLCVFPYTLGWPPKSGM